MFSIGGITALKQHPFFADVDWHSIERLEAQPPIDIHIDVESSDIANRGVTTPLRGSQSPAPEDEDDEGNPVIDSQLTQFFAVDFTKQVVLFICLALLADGVLMFGCLHA